MAALAPQRLKLSHLTLLSFSDVVQDDATMKLEEYLGSLTSLHDLSISRLRVSSRPLQALAAAVANLTRLTSLHMKDCALSSEDMRIVEKNLIDLVSLQSFWVNDNQLKDAEVLGRVISHLTSLEDINVEENDIKQPDILHRYCARACPYSNLDVSGLFHQRRRRR